jgi:hypothetical protein
MIDIWEGNVEWFAFRRWLYDLWFHAFAVFSVKFLFLPRAVANYTVSSQVSP